MPRSNNLSQTPTRFNEPTCRQGIISDSWEWSLDMQIFHRLMEIRGPCTVDLFASRLSAKLPTYYSWRSDPGATAVNAVTQPWKTVRGYAFPPFCLIGRCLTKIRSEGIPWVLLITPLWRSQTWFPLLQGMSVELPVLLPTNNRFLRNPEGTLHPMVLQGHRQLVAWTLSGIPSRTEAFQRELSHCCVHHGGAIQNPLTLVVGGSGRSGACRRESIPFVQLYWMSWNSLHHSLTKERNIGPWTLTGPPSLPLTC